MWPLDKAFSFEGQNIAYGKIGSGAPLILVHGTPFSSYVWRKIAPLLAPFRTVYAFDLLGYGQSSMPAKQDVSLGVQNRVMAAFMADQNIESPDVIAHDFGGATALRAHLLGNIEFKNLMLIDPVAIRPWGSEFVQHVRQYEAAFAGQPDYIQQAVLEAYISGAVFNPLPGKVLEKYCNPWKGNPGQGAFFQQIAQMDQRYTDEISDLLYKVRCPVTLLWGQNDDWIPIASGRKLAKIIQGCDFVEVPNCGHLMQEDAPEVIAAAALTMLQSAG